jgi:hypothetical protein
MRCTADAAANPDADAVMLRGGWCHRNGARRESRGREGCEVDARMPDGTTSHVTHPTQCLKVVQSVSCCKARHPPTVKNPLMTVCSENQTLTGLGDDRYREAEPPQGTI